MTGPAEPQPTSGIALTGVSVGLTVGLTALVLYGGGIGTRVGGGDTYAMALARHALAGDAYRAGMLPLWNPYEFCGVPLAGSAQGATFYPPLALAATVLDPLTAMRVLHALHALALVAALAWLARNAGAPWPATISGIAVATGGLTTVRGDVMMTHPHILFATTTLVLALVAWERLLAGARALPWLALVLGAGWLAGYAALPLDTAVLLGVFGLLDDRGHPRARLVLAGAAVTLGALLGGIANGVVLETIGESLRADDTTLSVGRSFFAVPSASAVITRAVERFGAAGFLAMIAGLLAGGRPARLWGTMAVLGTFAGNWPLNLLYEVWPFSGVRFLVGWDAVAGIAAGLLAARGLAATDPGTGRSAVLALAGMATAAVLAGTDVVAAATAVLVAVLLGFARGVPLAWVPPAAAMLLHGALLAEQAPQRPRQPAPDLQALAPHAALLADLQRARPGRVIAPELHEAGLVVRHGLGSPAGYEPGVPPRRMRAVTDRLELHRLFDSPRERARHVWPALARHADVAAMLGIGWVVTPTPPPPALRAAGFVPITTAAPDATILHRPPLPRFRFVRRIIAAGSDTDELSAVFAPSTDHHDVAVVPAAVAPTLSLGATDTSDALTVVVDRPSELILDVVADSPALLVVADNHHPGWHASVDGAATPLIRVNHTLRGLAVPAGAHRVVMRYAPTSFRVGALASLVGLLLTAIAAATGRPTLRP